MAIERIVMSNELIGMTISEDILEQLGFQIGDSVDVAVADRSIIVRSLEEAQRGQKPEDIVRDLISRHGKDYNG